MKNGGLQHMKNTDFDFKRIAQGYKNRPFLHKQVIAQFQNDIDKQQFAFGLDIGCGSGLSTKALRSVCANVIGTDISPEMINVAREVCGQDENIAFLVSSAEDLTMSDLPISNPAIKNARIDIVTAAGAIQWIDKDIFLSNMHQLMNEDGYLLIYDFAISDTMLENPAYTDWWHDQYLMEFPRPYRNESIWKNEDTAPYGFCMLHQLDLKMEHPFDLPSFIEFMMIQSNVNAKIENGERKEQDVYQWFQKTLSPIFHDQTQHFIFKGYSWYLKNKM